ncbi:DUF397 domain-containing protein [Streptomyces sp. NPDC006283]|uniref:DUF397 domain-containing protein n=1 Tax=Streptomyces sp. NPDC006283 TaxID=3156741 RepID=UPI0033A8B164
MDTGHSLTGARRRKSSYSGDTGGDCVEVAELAAHDSERPAGYFVSTTSAAFGAFVAAAGAGRP